MHHSITRRDFVRFSTLGTVLAAAPWRLWAGPEERLFRISLSERSLQRSLSRHTLDHLDFAATAREDFQIDAIEYASRFFKSKVGDESYLMEMNKRAADHGVRQLLIIVEDDGRLGDPQPNTRKAAVSAYRKWIDAAQALGCHGIGIDADKVGTDEDQLARLTESLTALAEYGSKQKINILVPNHGNWFSDAQSLIDLLQKFDSPRFGVLAQIHGFSTDDQYQDLARLIPFSKSVCAISRNFDENGHETTTDYFRTMKVVLEGGYHGYVSIEYKGDKLDEPAGIRATKALLERVRETLE